jgi:hypothetical protein
MPSPWHHWLFAALVAAGCGRTVQPTGGVASEWDPTTHEERPVAHLGFSFEKPSPQPTELKYESGPEGGFLQVGYSDGTTRTQRFGPQPDASSLHIESDGNFIHIEMTSGEAKTPEKPERGTYIVEHEDGTKEVRRWDGKPEGGAETAEDRSVETASPTPPQ